MSKKLTARAVIASREAAANANTVANEHLDAFKARVADDEALANDLLDLIVAVRGHIEGSEWITVPSRNAPRLESTANSYGFTLVEHETRRDLVNLVQLEVA